MRFSRKNNLRCFYCCGKLFTCLKKKKNETMTIDEMFLVQLFAILAMFLCVTTVTIITI